jgi:hypothetical protein
MSERPYIPQGTPITVTIDGHWDGYHNGNEPYMSYPGPGGTTKKVYIPHGAYVETKPEQTEKVEFVVDKTPARSETVAPGTVDELFGDRATVSSAELREYLGLPKLRVFRDNYNLTWWEIEPDKFYPADTRTNAEASAKAWPKDYRDMAYLEEHYTLTDVTDTGEPLDAERCGAVSLGLTGDRACMLPPDGHLVHEAENGLQWRSEDTPRKPEYGDRGPKIGDTVAVPLNDENGTIIVGSLVATYDDKFWIEGDDFDLQVPHQGSRITVIEPARPAVPEEPAGDVCVMDEATTQYVWDERPEDGDGLNWRAEDGTHYTWEHLWEKFGPLYRVERGPAISG